MENRLLERRTLYDRGLSDGEISRMQGVDPTAVLRWRQKQGLPANHSSGRPDNDLVPMRQLLHAMGWGVKSIARFQGVNASTVVRWRKCRGLGPQDYRPHFSRRRQAAEFQALQDRVVKAVGCRLPFDIAADAAATLMLDVIEGRVELNQIEQKGRVYGSRALREFANPFTTRSLDAEMPGTDGLREIDRLADDTASAWLERMGATVH
ncbi:hypothetical protein WBP07_12810 [Novosphingobium sp. BL-8A]|uniref:hypothetical protein n=1 Tax=Novosphingobium sp. BL-8A TaxID=3127639 RepID=UPI0037579552